MNLLDIVTKGSTDRSVVLRIIDETTGVPETGVVFNTSGIALWYRREGAAKTDITEATLAALTTAHTDGGFLHIADGCYRLDLPDAAFATAANYVDVGGTVTGMIVIGGRVRLVDYSLEDSVRMGLTALVGAALATGTVTTDAGNSATAFETSLSETADNYWRDSYLLLTSGVLSGQQKRITAYNGTTKIVTVAGGFTGTPADGVTFAIINR
jgi:hypothetical protein